MNINKRKTSILDLMKKKTKKERRSNKNVFSMMSVSRDWHDKQEITKIDEEIEKLETEEKELEILENKGYSIKEIIALHNEDGYVPQPPSIEETQFINYLLDGLVRALCSVLCGRGYHSRRADIAQEKQNLLKIKDRLRAKICRVYRTPNIRNKLRKFLKLLYRRCVGEDNITFGMKTNYLTNVIFISNEKEIRNYKNNRLAA